MSNNWRFDHETDAIPGKTSIFRRSITKANDCWHLVAIISKDGNISYRQVDDPEEKREIEKYARESHLID